MLTRLRSCWGIVGTVFNWFIKRRLKAWWSVSRVLLNTNFVPTQVHTGWAHRTFMDLLQQVRLVLTNYDRLRYNYITSAALDTGLIISTIIIFFSLYFTETTSPRWFGNIGALSTLDMSETAVQSVLPPGQTFGPSTWI